ncbi:MAG TPA: choice-of-anchor D domain-containing protein [Terriglobales bacterium]|nr:choice-of-anchor D domain-containing protein [Terriglobales bacterium]
MQHEVDSLLIAVLGVLTALVLSLPVMGAPVPSKIMSIPITFEKNIGQAPSSYQFLTRHGGILVLFSEQGMDIVLPRRENSRTAIGFRLVGATPVLPQGRNRLPGLSNYLIGADPSGWIRGVSQEGQVVYPGVYRGIDLIFHGNGADMEHDFRVAARADPTQLRFRIQGAQKLAVTASGDLSISCTSGDLVFRKPVAYQQSSRGRRLVAAAFVVNADQSIQFRLGAYDKARELVIDPVFIFSTYLAGSNYDQAVAITSDSSGNVYVTGTTDSLDFPVKNGIRDTTVGSTGFVSKLDPTGQTLLYSTFLGGSGSYGTTVGGGIALDSNGNIIVAGISSADDFPQAGSVPTTSCTGGNSCYFLASLNPSGSAFNYVGLIGGAQGPVPQWGSVTTSLFVDKSGNAYVAGITDSSAFEITPGTLATTVPNYPFSSTFVLKANSSGALVYSTIIPGTAAENVGSSNNLFFPAGISVDANGQATIAGTAGPGLPSTSGVVQPTFPNSLDVGNVTAGFVLQLNAVASAINYATYVPGTDSVGGFAVDSLGDSYVTGQTSETNLPVSGNAYQKTMKSSVFCTCNSGFLLELNGAGTSVLAATYLGGTPTPAGTSFSGIALDSHSNVYVGGMSASPDFPLVHPFVSLYQSGNETMVLAEMNTALSSLLFGSFLSPTDQPSNGTTFAAIAINSQNNIVVAGGTSATDFPTTTGSFQPVPPAPGDHPVIAELNMATPAPSVCLDQWNVNFGTVLANTPSSQVVHLTNCGNAPLSIGSMTSSAAAVTVKQSCGTLQAGTVCPISLIFTPTGAAPTAGTVTVKDNAVISPQFISFSGQGVTPQLSPFSGSFNFGHLLVNTSGLPNTFIFSNIGSAPLTITAVSVDGDFSITQDGCLGTLQPTSLCIISITFSPTAAGICTGVLTIVSNDPAHPRAGLSLVGTGDSVYAAPVVQSLTSPTAQIGTGAITVQVLGASFYPASVIQVNGITQATTYSGGGQLQATLDSAVTGSIGEVAVDVVNPVPGGGTSVAVPLTLYEGVFLGTTFVASVPGSQMIYASIPSSAATNPNTVIPINPATAVLGTPIPVGNNPDLLAASSDGSYLFVVAEQDQTLQRINLSTQKVDQTFAFPPNNVGSSTLSGMDLKGVPGSPQEVVLSVGVPGYAYGELALYNGTGLVNYVPNPNPLTTNFLSIAFAGNPLTIYSLPFSTALNPFFNVITLGSQGLSFTPFTENLGIDDTTGAQVVSDGMLLYTVSGQIWNPSTRAQVGTFPVTLDNATSYPNYGDLLIDVTNGNLFTVGAQPYLTSAATVLSRYGQQSHELTGALAFTQLENQPQSLVRWGSNGFAFTAQDGSGNQDVLLLTSSLAAAQSSSPVPQLISVTPSSTPKDSFGLLLILNGQNFVPGSAVMWNMTALQTTYYSSTALAAMVPGTDFANSGSASVTVSNPAPGGGSSNAILFTIAPQVPLLSFSSSQVTFPTQTIGTTSPARTISLQNPGSATLTISGIKIVGTGAASFQQSNTCGTFLAPGANCSMSLSFAPVAGGLQTAGIAVTDNAAGSPQVVPVSGAGVGLGLAIASGGSASATVVAGSSASYKLIIGGAGVSATATITCTGAPQGASCSVPSSVNVSPTSKTSLTVTVTTTAGTSATLYPSLRWLWGVALFGWLVLPAQGRKRWLTRFPLFLLIVICSCGGGSGNQANSGGTPTGQYTLTVTASGDSDTQSLPLTLKVQ